MQQFINRKAFTALLIVLALISVTIASRSEPSNSKQRSDQTKQDMRSMAGVTLECASHIIGTEVTNPRGEKIGKVKDIVLTTQRDRVDYVAVESGSVVRGRTLAIPWTEFQFSSKMAGEKNKTAVQEKTDRLILNLPEASADKAKGYESDSWPNTVSANWREQLTTDQPEFKRTEPEKSEFELRRVSKLIGTDVGLARTTAKGDATVKREENEATATEKIAKVKDAVITRSDGRLTYAFIELEKIESHKGELSTVPWNSLQFQAQPKMFATLKAPDKTTLITYAFKPDQQLAQLPLLAQSSYSRKIFMAYDQGPQWEALGFVNPVEKPTDQPTKKQQEPKSQLPPQSQLPPPSQLPNN